MSSAAIDRLSIVHVTSPAPLGGLESVVRLLAEGQMRRGHDVHVVATVSPSTEEQPFLEALRAAGVGVSVLELGSRQYRREITQLAQLYGERHADVVHSHGYRSDVVAAIAARRVDAPTISTVHGFTGSGWRGRLYERIQRWALRRNDAVVAVSRPLADDLMDFGIPPRRIHLVTNAFQVETPVLPRDEARKLLSWRGDDLLLGWVGRLSREKGPDVLIGALSLLRDLPVSLIFVGAGSDERRLRRQVAKLGLGRRVTFAGAMQRAERLYSAFDALVISSRTEGTPIVLFEAMASCTPIITTRVGGIPDVVTHREALIVSPEDEAALAGAIRALYSSPDSARQRASEARQRLTVRFGVAPWLDRYDAIYKDILRPRRRS